MGQITVMTGPVRRRRWSDEERLEILAEAFAPGACVPANAAPQAGQRGKKEPPVRHRNPAFRQIEPPSLNVSPNRRTSHVDTAGAILRTRHSQIWQSSASLSGENVRQLKLRPENPTEIWLIMITPDCRCKRYLL